MSLTPEGKKNIDAFLDRTVEGRNVPAAFLGVTTADGPVYFNCQGERIWGQPDEGDVKEDTGTAFNPVLQLFSTTKLVTTIACLQLIEQGKISLDDADLIEKHLPELGKLDILGGYTDNGKEILKKPKNRITLKMLLTHTSGLSYASNSPNVARWVEEHKPGSMLEANAPISAFAFPLNFEPGTAWLYSMGIDWAGFLVARVSGLTLEEYFQKNIFAPLGITNLSFHPPKDYQQRKMAMATRDPAETGVIKLAEGATMDLGRSYDNIGPNYAGGAGLFGTARDYLRFLQGILASAHPSDTNTIVSPESFAKLFTDELPQDPKIKAGLQLAATRQNVHDPALLTGEGEHIGHSIGLLLNHNDSKNGRKAGSGCWDGAAKTMYWLDPKQGIAGVCFTNLMTPNPDPWNKVYTDFERVVYDSLA